MWEKNDMADKDVHPHVTFTGNVTVNGPMFDIHDNQHVHITNGVIPEEKQADGEKQTKLPEPLATPQAMKYWKRLQDAGLMDENYYPKVSRTKAAFIANELSECLNIPFKWKYFEELWKRNNMRNDYNSALDQRQSLELQDLLKNLFAD